MKLASSILAFAFSIALTACGSSSESTPAASTAWTNTAAQTIISTKCATAGCHNGTQKPNFATMTEAAAAAYDSDVAPNARTRVSTSNMPVGGGLTSAEIATLTSFFTLAN